MIRQGKRVPESPCRTAAPPRGHGNVDLMLFFSGTRTSPIALQNAADQLVAMLGSEYTIRLIDIAVEPEKALEHRIVATPLIISRTSGQERRVLGDLSDLDQVLKALALR